MRCFEDQTPIELSYLQIFYLKDNQIWCGYRFWSVYILKHKEIMYLQIHFL